MTLSTSTQSDRHDSTPIPGAGASVASGILWMLLTTLLFVCQDSTARILVARYPATEVAFMRYFVHFALVGAFLALRAPRLLRSRRPVLQLTRSSFLLANTLFGMMALKIMPFLDFSAVVWVAPVLVTALSIVVLHEKVSLTGWISVFIGLAGVWIIVVGAGFDVSALMILPLMAALTNALYQIATRFLRTADAPLTTLFYTAIAGTAFCALFLPFSAVRPAPADLALMTLLGVLGVASHFCIIRAFAAAPANVIAPFGYTALLWASLFSVVIFAEIPTLRTIIGSCLIVGAGLAIFFGPRAKRSV
ncbi:DMT family transporter [Methylocella silvestris]|uniref:EamA family transporter n=1 Tax=Methylocella silvestris TaxID=199596 RepID=A0A2J7TED8_METSI|nr:DMT family transporter [Methylocella silvestris]PNG25135.1 EamA family transporter [Methylocella silvestris]